MNNFLTTLVAILLLLQSNAQTGSVGIGTNTPNPNAALDISSTSKAFLPPRMTLAQARAIPNPVLGMIVFDIGSKGIRMFNGIDWILVGEKEKDFSDAPGSFAATLYNANGPGNV